jgi:hypothetical protein
VNDSLSENKVLNILKWISLIGLFLFCQFGINPYLFKAITWSLERLVDATVNWDNAPFLRTLFSVGIGIIFSWVVTKGVYNIYNRNPFFHETKWGKLFVIVFCITFWSTLNTEIDNLVPKYKYEYEEYEYEDDGSPLAPLKFGAIALTVVIGWALWRHVERYGKHWECPYCGTLNSAGLNTCGNPNCGEEESEVEEDSEP